MGKRVLTPEEAKAMGLNPWGPDAPEVDTRALAEGLASAEESLNLPAGYAKQVSPADAEAAKRLREGVYTPDASPEAMEAAIADLNTKRTGEEAASNARIGMLKKLLAAMQTGSLGLGDQMAGVKAALTGGDYQRAQQAAKKEAAAAQAENPLSSLAGLAPHMLVPGASSLTGRLATAGLTGTVAGADDAPAEASIADTGREGLEGGLGSMVIQGGLEAASPVLGKLAQALRQGSNSQAARAMGMRGGISNKARKMGLKSEDDISHLGEFAMDEGLVPVWGSKKVAQEKSRAFANMHTNARDAVLDEATLHGGFNPALSAAKMRGQLLNLNPAQVRSIGPAAKAIEDVEALAQSVNPGDFRAASSLKSSHQGTTNFGDVPNLSDAQKLMRRVVGAEREAIEEQVGSALGADRGRWLGETNEKIGNALKLEEIAKEAATREAQNRVFGLPETILAGSGLAGGAAMGEPLKGGAAAALLALGSNLAKTRGSGPGAYALRGASNAVGSAQAVNQLPAAVGAARSLTPDEEQKQRLLRLLQSLK